MTVSAFLESHIYHIALSQCILIATMLYWYRTIYNYATETAKTNNEKKLQVTLNELDIYKKNLMTKQSHRIKDAIEQNTVELQARVKTLEAKVEKYRMKHKLGKSKARQLSQVYAQRTAKLKSVAAIDTLEDGHSRGIIDKGTENFPSKRSSVGTSNQSSKIGDKEDENLIKEEEDLLRKALPL